MSYSTSQVRPKPAFEPARPLPLEEPRGNDRVAASAGAIRVLIAAGGTGGHLYPGIAIAEEWMRLHPDSKVLFVGTSRGPEQKAVPRAGFRGAPGSAGSARRTDW